MMDIRIRFKDGTSFVIRNVDKITDQYNHDDISLDYVIVTSEVINGKFSQHKEYFSRKKVEYITVF